MRWLFIGLVTATFSALIVLSACTAAGGVVAPEYRYLTSTQIAEMARDEAAWVRAQEIGITAEWQRRIDDTATAIHERGATETASANSTATQYAVSTAESQARADGTSTAQAESRQTETAVPLHTQTALDLKAKAQEVENQKLLGTAMTIFLVIVVAVLIYLVFAWARTHIRGKAKKESVVLVENGSPLIMADRGQIIIEPGKHVGPVIEINDSAIERTILDDPDKLLEAFKSFLTLQAVRATHPSASLARSLRLPGFQYSEAHAPGQPAKSASPEISIETPPTPALTTPEAKPLPANAPWEIINEPNQGLCLGVNQDGPITLDFEKHPHLLIAGTSGAGKTRYGLRPLITSALLGGHRVAILDRSGLDFTPFNNHANTSLITLSDVKECVGYLRRINDELQQRLRHLRETGLSTWSMTGQPRIVIVVDEFSNLADSASNTKEREELWRQARMIAAEGRKAGIHLILALQNPNHKSIDLRIRRNTAQMAFRVADKEASRLILGTAGAETLGQRQFMLVSGSSLITGVAFAPSDQEISGSLKTHAIPALPRPTWLLESKPSNADSPVPGFELDEIAQAIKDMHSKGMSARKIEKEIFGYSGGNAHEFVKRVLGGEI